MNFTEPVCVRFNIPGKILSAKYRHTQRVKDADDSENIGKQRAKAEIPWQLRKKGRENGKDTNKKEEKNSNKHKFGKK